MFPWNIAKSAEAMFSRWAIKRVCKFLLKKKLGKFILGDVDLNQLDVQLSAGTVQLSDLALNVDYLNQKFGATAGVFVKEGSIGSMLVTLPWGGNGCGIELDELELVIAPREGNASYDGSEASTSGQDNSYSGDHESGRVENDAATKKVKISSIDVHEGVKTIANMVKGLLSSFHLRIKKLILAFDPCAVEEKNKRFCRTLVLRIAEVECGTRISEDAHLIHETRENIIGLSWLTNFVKFRGAALEFLQLEDIKEKTPCACTSGTTFGEWFSHCCQSTAMTSIITGKNGGFSGHLKISIPWKNGALDVRKVDADVYVDPLQLKFQPSTALCFMYLWHIFKDMGSSREDQMLCKTTESVSDNAASNYHSTMQAPDSLTNDNVLVGNDSSPVKCSSFVAEECRPKTMISESHFISDWVGRSQNDKTYVEHDFGASVDQFFECLDELRSSQSALGNSGTWKWTSYISAITAATNLASGSLHIPSVQQHVETNLKVTFANISLLVSFFDEEPVQTYSVRSQTRAGPNIHFLEMKFLDLLLVLQVCPEKMNFEATVQHMELDDHFSSSDDILDPRRRADLIQKLQDAVQDALPPSRMSGRQAGVIYSRSCDVDIYTDNVLKVAVLKTSGISQCEVTVNTGTSDNFVLGPTSFTLKLPPFVLWANLGLFNKSLDLLKEIGSCETSHGRNENISSTTHVSSISATESLRGNIFLANARIILMEGYSSFDHLIALDFSYPIFGGQIGEASQPEYVAGPRKGYLLQKSRSLHLSWGDLTACLIVSDPEKYSGTESSSKFNFFAHKILSISDGTGHFSTITMFWQDGALTGPWVTKKAKLLATAENLKNGDRFIGKDYECVSVTNVKEMEDFDNHARQDIVLSSGFFLHAQLSPLMVNLGKIQYDSLIHFVRKLIDCFPSLASDKVSEVSKLSQGSILVECDFVEIAITMDKIASVDSSIQRELPGSWHSFRLKIKKFELLSVSNLGGVENASFLWVVHGEGSLWGSITGVPHEELLLISCRNSARGRGDGQGSNLFTPSFSGSDIVHLWDPEAFHSYMSFAVRCGTIVAMGGRVDWWDTLYSFFTLSSHEVEQEGNSNLQKGGSERSVPFGTSFVLNLADVGVCYEPYKPDFAVHNGSDVVASSITINKTIDEHYFACLLAASSFRLSNTSVPDSSVSEYKIWVQDLGLLLCPVSGPKIVGGSFDVKHLSKAGYVKVAQVAHFEALLRTYSEEDLMWEAESLGLDIVLNTCCDTTSGLIHLGAQLQQLFAPDMEDTLVHLQSRWNNVQGANADTVNGTLSDNASPLDSEVNMGLQNNQHLSNLMEEICEDAFQLVGNSDGQSDYNDTDILMPLNGNFIGEPSNANVTGGENFAGCFPFTGSVPVVELESNETAFQYETIPEFIEEYFLSDSRSLSELSLKRELSNDVLRSRTGLVGSGDVFIRDNGWYRNTSLQILENHVSEDFSQTNLQEIKDSGTSSSCTGPDGYGNIKGRILLKNMNVVWRMYGGTDWSKFQKTWTRCSSGRDTTTCLEVSLSGMQLQYDFFPDGGICVSSLSLGIQDFCLNDTSKNAPWKLVLGYYESKDHPRKSSSKAFKMDLQSVRPDSLTPLEEYQLRVCLLPIRLHLHQSQLDFLINFFGGQSVPFKPSDDAGDDVEAGKEPRKIVNVGQRTIIEEALLPYFQKFDIWPVLIRVDYSPSHVDLAALRSGKYVELVNIVPWKGVELQLKHVHSVGVYGWSSVCETILGEWLEDISQNQIHKLLKGLPPIRSLVAVGSGATKLVTLPVKNYKKDRRLLKGVQRGTIAFLRSISLEAIGLGVHLAAGAHNILLQVEYILASIPPSVPSCPPESRGNKNVRSNQPKDALQGMKQACESISGGFRRSASALVRTPLKRYQWGDGIGSALATAVQAAPVAAIAPASAAARAMHCALLGVRNSLDPEHRKESLDKYTGSAQQREFM